MQVPWGYDAIYPVRERWHYVVSVPDCFSTYEYLHWTASTRVVLVQPNPEILVHDYTLRSLLSLGFAPPPSRLLASSTARGTFQCLRHRFVYVVDRVLNPFRCPWVLTSTRCQYLQVLWGYDAIYRVRGRWHYVCLLYTSPSPRDLSTSRMPSSA